MTADPNYRITISLYEEGTEAHVGAVIHEYPPSVGDLVRIRSNTWEVVKRAWRYPDPASVTGIRGDLLTCLVRRADDLFLSGPPRGGGPMNADPIIVAGRPMVSHAHRWDRIGTRRPDDIRPLAPGDRYTGTCPKANSGAYAWRRSDGTCVCCGKYVPQDGPHGKVTGIVASVDYRQGTDPNTAHWEEWWAIRPRDGWEASDG